VKVGPGQFLAGEVDARGLHGTGDHLPFMMEEVLVVAASGQAVGDDQGGVALASGAAAALGVVGWSGRDVAQVHQLQVGDVDAQFHGGRAEEAFELAVPETELPLLPPLVIDLGGVLPPLRKAQQAGRPGVEADEIAVGLLFHLLVNGVVGAPPVKGFPGRRPVTRPPDQAR